MRFKRLSPRTRSPSMPSYLCSQVSQVPHLLVPVVQRQIPLTQEEAYKTQALLLGGHEGGASVYCFGPRKMDNRDSGGTRAKTHCCRRPLNHFGFKQRLLLLHLQ